MKNGSTVVNAGGPAGDDLASLFPNERYEFQMRMRRREIAEYFRASADADAVLAERRRWLPQAPGHYFAFTPGAEAVAGEALGLLSGVGAVSVAPAAMPGDARRRFLEVSQQLEPDLVLLQPDSQGNFSMVAGSVCFPSSWSLAEKIGRTIDEIHAPVPGLNERLGSSITQFLRRMSPGVAWCRENWGLSASPELNQHPSRALPKLTGAVTFNSVWLRVERQALVALPESGGALFAIRVEAASLSDVAGHAECRDGLRRALETMPEEIALYKGLSAARTRLVELLR